MKKILCLALCLSLVMTMFCVIAGANEGVRPNTENETASDIKEAVAGDINGDEIVDIIDVALGRAYIIGNVELTAEQLKAGKALNPTDDVFDIIDIVSMRAYIINGNLNPIEPPETDTETDSNTDTENNNNDEYKFLEVTPQRLERAYRALIEYNAKGTAVTDEDIRIVKEDCIKYVLNSDNPVFKTWTWDKSLNSNNGGFYVGVLASDTALEGIDKDGNFKYVYNIDKEYYNGAYDMFRNECHHLAIDFIETSKGYGHPFENCRFNFDVAYSKETYVIRFIYK